MRSLLSHFPCPFFGLLRPNRTHGRGRASLNRTRSRRSFEAPAPPLVISVAFPVLYRNKHILHAINAGAASKPEGIAELKQLVAHTPASAQIVIYCGCCPMVKCPNVRPAYRALKDLGFQHVRVLNIPANMHTDWYYRNYPSEPGSASANDNR